MIIFNLNCKINLDSNEIKKANNILKKNISYILFYNSFNLLFNLGSYITVNSS